MDPEPAQSLTVNQCIDQIAQKLEAADLHYGHGAIDAQSEALWLVSKQLDLRVKDLENDRLLQFINQRYFLIWTILIAISYFISWEFCVFFVLGGAGWSLIFSGIFNTVSHMNFFGSYRNFETNDQTTNSRWLHYFLGDGLHNNHHHISGKYDQAFNKGEFDPAGWITKKLFAVTKKVS